MNINNKKINHLKFALLQNNKKNDFDNYKLYYNSLPKYSFTDIDLSSNLNNKNYKIPIFINSITFGDDELNIINEIFYEVSKKLNILFMSGSISPFLKKIYKKNNKLDLNYAKKISKNYYIGNSINIGLDKNPNHIIDLIKIFNPNFLQLHLNLIQEICMVYENSDINTKNWRKNLDYYLNEQNYIKKDTHKVPIILKETGFGMSFDVISENHKKGIKLFDISGKGGTNFAKIENMISNDIKRNIVNLNYLENIGFSCIEILEDYQNLKFIHNNTINNKNIKFNTIKNKDNIEYLIKNIKNIEIITSGGIRNPLDAIICLSFGSKMVGISGILLKFMYNLINNKDNEFNLNFNTFLKSLNNIKTNKEYFINNISKFIINFVDQMKYLCIISNSKNIKELENKIYKVN